MDQHQRHLNLKQALWLAATDRQSLILAFVGIALAIVSHLVSQDRTGPLWLVWYVLIGSLTVIWIILAALRTALSQDTALLPAVRAVVPDTGDSGRPILLLEPSALFGNTALVSIYHRDIPTGYEVLLGHGTVRTVQSDMKIQVKVDEWLPGNAQLVDALRAGQGALLPQIIVRPSVSREQPQLGNFGAQIVQAIIASRNSAVSFEASEMSDSGNANE